MSYVIPLTSEAEKFSVHRMGGKALSLCRMLKAGLDVPMGVVLDTSFSKEFDKNGQRLAEDFDIVLRDIIRDFEHKTGLVFGGKENPLFLSVRSGAAVSMPGMLDTVLNIGLTLENVTYHKEFALYARFVCCYAEIVHHIYLDEEDNNHLEPELLVAYYLHQYQEIMGCEFPQNPLIQLKNAVVSVLKSVHNHRAETYRHIHNISVLETATAVIIQKMVFGCSDGFSGTGVAVSCNPNNGDNVITGEYLPQSQGDILVGGHKTPYPLTFLQEHHPALYQTLCESVTKAEAFYPLPIEVEFTIEKGHLWFLQARIVKISDVAMVRYVTDMVKAQKMTIDAALLQIDPHVIERFLHPTAGLNHGLQILDRGVAAAPGAAVGHAVFTASEAIRYNAEGKPAILIRHETSPEDIHGMYAAVGILTGRGGMTSHAAVAARGMGRPCVTGVENIKIRSQDNLMMAEETTIRQGDMITINGSTGEVILGSVAVSPPEPPEAFYKLNQMAAQTARMQIRANIDGLTEADIALKFQIEGVGLYRTEYALYEGGDINNVRRLVLAYSKEERADIITSMKFAQIKHFKEVFKHMGDLPVTIRLLDPPLHEFFPETSHSLSELAEKLGFSTERLQHRLRDLKEFNPMLGVRGCRIGILYPDIYALQVEFLLRAWVGAFKDTGLWSNLEIMIPFVGFASEFNLIRDDILKVYDRVKTEYPDLPCPKIGAMIELPRAALCADKIAQTADFLSFGTNDLTQTVLGISRDDSPRFMTEYMRRGLVPFDPFVTLDLDGVGMLIAIAVQKARHVNPDIIIGLCGEHGADPECVEFCEIMGVDYVSCSPYRVPVARLAAARASIKKHSLGRKYLINPNNG